MLLPLNTIRWRERFAQPDWYLGWVESPEYRRLTEPPVGPNDTGRAELKEAFYVMVETLLAENAVTLGSDGPDWDAERGPINGVILHHTGNPPGITPERLNAMQLLKLYAPQYARKYQEPTGPPLWSNHLRNGRPVFWAYHWLVRDDGRAERLLEDREIGWQAGDWAYNCSTVAVCLDGRFEGNTSPSDRMLRGVANLLRTQYRRMPAERILGHCEIPDRSGSTVCPGTHFVHGWKWNILHRLYER